MSSIAIFFFDSQEIRFVDGKPVANDVAMILGYKDTANAVHRLVDDDYKGVCKIQTPGGAQSVTILEEAGIYQLVFASKLLIAKRFRSWVFEDVLPTIRKTGSYAVPLPHRNTISEVKERAEVSPHLVRAWIALRESDQWLSNKELAQKTNIAERTARGYTKYLFALGLLDKLEVFPGHRFRISATAEKRNPAAYQRLEETCSMFSNRFALA